jgi:recombination DNA repair RAD52 pathway protein
LNKIESTDNGKYNSCVSVIMRVTLKDGTFHEVDYIHVKLQFSSYLISYDHLIQDIGLGSVENCRSKTQAITKVYVHADFNTYLAGINAKSIRIG